MVPVHRYGSTVRRILRRKGDCVRAGAIDAPPPCARARGRAGVGRRWVWAVCHPASTLHTRTPMPLLARVDGHHSAVV